MATLPHVAVATTASAVCVGVDATAASTSGRRVVLGKGLNPLRQSLGGGGRVDPQRSTSIVRAAKGTQFFKLGGRKDEDEDEDEDDAPASGTQFFSALAGWGKKEKEPEEPEEEEKPSFFGGTQRRKLGAKRDAGNGVAGAAMAKKSENSALDVLSFGRGRRNDPRTVFVAGATGQIGARISQQLLLAGFNIRGGVRDLFFAQQLAEFATQYGVITREEARRLNAVEFDFKNVESVAKAIGNASKVVVTVGPVEDGPRGQVSVDDALRVLEAALVANVNHFVAVYEPGTGRTADGPLAGISSFFSLLLGRRAGGGKDVSYLLDTLAETDLAYTFIRSPATEGVDDYSPSTSNLVVSAEGSPDGSGKVSKVQVASVVAAALSNTTASENKVVVVASDPFATPRPLEESLSVIPTDGRRAVFRAERAEAEKEAQEKEARELAEAEKEAQEKEARELARAAADEARRATQLASQLETEAKRLATEESRASALAAKAKAKAEAAAASVDGLTTKAKELGLGSFVSKLTSSKGGGGGGGGGGGEKKTKPEKELAGVSAGDSASQQKSPRFFGDLFRQQETIFVEED